MEDKLITVEMLLSIGACQDGVAIFQCLFPNGATWDHAVKWYAHSKEYITLFDRTFVAMRLPSLGVRDTIERRISALSVPVSGYSHISSTLSSTTLEWRNQIIAYAPLDIDLSTRFKLVSPDGRHHVRTAEFVRSLPPKYCPECGRRMTVRTSVRNCWCVCANASCTFTNTKPTLHEDVLDSVDLI